ncbi:PspA/IM30 family protein [Aeromicrobium stalagmiti]|uniref:PspA/IM30 family protein n=1 Tax=Aeromicrobium stalagmiti TaxID=2738988 RepID=UPI0015690103|nr:PspA/IM30 family protein [Aeromicrobium stalagmiti]NRQ51048.1 PspA/IM30 family protein [Aeromicrobium stalagmiti]
MSIWTRIAQIFRSQRAGDDVGALKDRLDETYRTQTALLRQVRRGVADVATSRKRVELQLASIRQQTAQLDDQAAQAVAGGNDDEARALLTRKVTLEKTAVDLQQRSADLKAEEDKLELAAMKVEQEVEGFRVRKDTLAARHTAAAARAEINSATSGIGSTVSDVGQAMEAAERRTRELEARSDAVDELVAEGIVSKPGESADDALRRQFDAALDGAEVDRQLDEITHRKDDRGPQQIQE